MSSKKIKGVLLSPWLALITFAILLSVKLTDPFLVESSRLKFYDYLMLDTPVQSEQIVVANIGEKAIEKYGQWPFNRQVHAEIVQDLYGAGAGIVGSTVMFPEKDRFGGDKKFAETLSQYPVVLSQTVSLDCSRKSETIRRTGVAVIGDGQPTEFLPQYPCVLSNIPALQETAAGVGVTSTLPEADGVVRRVPLLAQSDGEYYPAFALEILRVAAGDPSYQAKINQTGVEALRIPQYDTIKTDEYGRVFVNPNYRFESFEIGAGPLPDLSGKIVVVGVTAAGIVNPVATPSGAQTPHQVQASLLETMLNGDTVAIPNWSQLADLAAFLVLALALIIVSRFKYNVIYVAVLLGGYLYLPVYLFSTQGMLFDVTFNIFAVALIYIHIYTVKYISEFLQKQQIKKQFGTYLSPDLVAQLQRQPELLQLGGTEQELSIMFTDVRGFTTISEHYGKNVQGLTSIMNRYMTAMTKAILENKGTLDKYIGDAQMAFWNAPVDNPKHALDSVKTAFQMLKALEEFNNEITAEGVPAFGMGLGINTDTVVVGNMGSDQRFDYTCLGDGVNLAARLEGQSKPYGVKIIIGPKTAEYVRDQYQVIELDLIAVKGKTEPARIYTVVEKKDTAAERAHVRFLDAYRKGEWNRAMCMAYEMGPLWKGELAGYYEAMLERMNTMKEAPANWDGVYRATSK
ncbi:COG4252 Predicted transmembrane sensor domain [uncultured Caudovirales phage]|uniref:COG4252 Predicted transmembrane sensor domain n=1 Tax=uncultured Caudovirales phage TaxID=2100421 RepID=A0A6J5MFF5_9CAUD|nr:COG4252 Predicted transmembrane sensor domain [uncultured Caudovirales phage]